MSKKIRPSLKDYLRTGVVRLESDDTPPPSDAPIPSQEDSEAFFLSLLSGRDRKTWQPILDAGIVLHSLPLDLIPLREDFRTADKNRFTFYILDKKGEPLRVVRTSVQIRNPFEFLVKWDETGILTLYKPEGS